MAQRIQVSHTEEAKQQVVHLFGRAVPDRLLAQAVGALDGAAVDFSAGEDALVARVQHRYVSFQQRLIKRDEEGQLFVRNLYFEKQSYAPPLTGLRALLNQIRAGQLLGIHYISLNAAGEYGENQLNGYYTWARYGFNDQLKPDEKTLLPPNFRHLQTTNEVMQAGQAEWWKMFGKGREMVFALAEGSSMMETLELYLAELKEQGRWEV
jgi:hypothetical protein